MNSKIGIVAAMPDHSWAGSEELWFRSALILLKRGHEVSVFYPRRRGYSQKYKFLVEAGAKIYRYGMPKGKIWRVIEFIFSPIIGKDEWLLSDSRLKRSGDVFLVNQGMSRDGLQVMEKLWHLGIPYTILLHLVTDAHWPSPSEGLKIRRIYEAALRVFFVSLDNIRIFRLQTSYMKMNEEVVWSSLNLDTSACSLPDFPGSETIKVAMAGRIEPTFKGQDLMLDVMSMRKWRERKIHLTIYGNGPWLSMAEEIVRVRKLKNVTFGGFRTPEEIWSENHFLVLPSRHEGKALVMLEALFLARPVVATAIAGAREEIKDGINGFVAESPSPESLDRALERLWQRKIDLEKMGLNGRDIIIKRMPKDASKDFADLLEAVCGRRN